MKAYGGDDVYLHVLLTSALLEVSGQLYAPVALTRWKKSPVSIGQEAGWPRNRSGGRGEKKIFPYRDSNSDPSAVQPARSCYTDCASPAPLYNKGSTEFWRQHVEWYEYFEVETLAMGQKVQKAKKRRKAGQLQIFYRAVKGD
jgi:hypothetical protein